MRWRSLRLITWAQRRSCALRPWLRRRTPRTFCRRCSAPSARDRRLLPFRCHSRTRAMPARKVLLVHASRLFRRFAGLLRAYMRRALFPHQRLQRPEPRRVVQRFLPGQRNKSGLRQQYRSCRNRERKALFGAAERLSLSNELVAGCTCNGKDQIGLAPVKIENDPTLRKGDLVAGADGLMVAGRVADKRGASLNFSPASELLRARVPVVASE